MNWRMTLSLIGSTVALSIAAQPSMSNNRPAPPNIVLVLYDTLRQDHVGCYGYTRDTTPTIDRIAKQGVRFENAFSTSSWTLPAVASLFTSLSPTAHGAVNSKSKMRAPSTLAKELQSAGYQTVAFVSNPTVSKELGLADGFDLYDDYSVSLASDLDLFDDQHGKQGITAIRTSPLVNQLATQWLTKTRDPKRPFFLVLIYFDPHADYVPPPPYDTQFDPDYTGTENGSGMYGRHFDTATDRDKRHLEARYDGEIRYTDDHVAAVLSTVDTLNLNNTMLILTADHGEEFWDHGGMYHGRTLYDELIRVPLVIRWPGQVDAGTVRAELTSLLDIMPTALHAAGIPVPGHCQGKSLITHGQTTSPPGHDALFLETEVETPQQLAIRTLTKKVIFDTQSATFTAFDLTTDAGEKTNEFPNQPAWAVPMVKRLNTWHRGEMEKAKAEPAEADVLSPTLLQQLRSMGYAH